MKTITVYDDTEKRLEQLAEENDTTVAEIVEEMLYDYENSSQEENNMV